MKTQPEQMVRMERKTENQVLVHPVTGATTPEEAAVLLRKQLSRQNASTVSTFADECPSCHVNWLHVTTLYRLVEGKWMEGILVNACNNKVGCGYYAPVDSKLEAPKLRLDAVRSVQ